MTTLATIAWKARLQRFWFGLLLCLVAVGMPPIREAFAQSAPVEVDAKVAVRKLAEALTTSRNNTYAQLSRIGFGDEVNRLQSPGASQLHSFSSLSIIEGLYQRAAANGDGDRLLAVLHQHAAAHSAQMAIDPDFAHLRRFAVDDLDLKKRPIQFAPPEALSAVRPPLPPAAEQAIVKLSQHYGGRGLAQARLVILQNFKKEGFDKAVFEKALRDSSSPEDAIRRILHAGTPPPSETVALRTLLKEAAAASAALSIDSDAYAIMEELSDEIPKDYQQYAQAEEQFPSRQKQKAETGTASAAERRTTTGTLLAKLDRGADNGSGAADWRPSDDPPPSGPSTPGGSPGGGKPNGSADPRPRGTTEANTGTRSYESYVSETFGPREPTHPGAGKPSRTSFTPRTYRVARISARAGRGISAGGTVTTDIPNKPETAVWLSNKNDDRFGRLFVTFRSTPGSPPVVAASRVLFTDSFRAAESVLWGASSKLAEFRDGEILVLMSMDPKSEISKNAAKMGNAAERELLNAAFGKLKPDELRRLKTLEDKFSPEQMDGASTQKKLELLASYLEFEELMSGAFDRLDPAIKKKAEDEIKRWRARRGVVLHPALHGRELSWSAVRIDFWFNQLDELGEEAEKMTGRRPSQVLNPNLLKGMATWQYYERDSLVSLRDSQRKARDLVVSSLKEEQPGSRRKMAETAERSHFAIAMFSGNPGAERMPVEDGLYRRPDVEEKLQPLLDWAAVNHHDYMRLNDFSEAFSLLRWIRSAGVGLTVIDLAGDRATLPTPDAVDIGTGPQVEIKKPLGRRSKGIGR